MRSRRFVSRRQLLTAGSVGLSTAIAGCAGVLNQIADQLLEDVNVLNDTEQERAGSIVVRADDETILDSEFRISGTDNGNDDNANIGTYADIWSGSGTYTAEISLQQSLGSVSTDSATVTIDDPDKEMLLVGLGLQDADEPIVFRVGTSFTDVVED
jgi:hypothetical protein